MDEDIRAMVAETTRQAKEVVKHNKELSSLVKTGKEKNLTIKELAKLLQDESTKYAEKHHGNFGELFIAELDAVDWRGLVAEV